MKTAGSILSALFDDQFVDKAHKYSKLFNSWEDITAKNGIAAAAANSRIRDLEKGILLIETDHPGWKQILQTKQSQLLDDYRSRFPDLDISGISLILGRYEPQLDRQAPEEKPAPNEKPAGKRPAEPAGTEINYDAIKDDEFREQLIRLGQIIAEDER